MTVDLLAPLRKMTVGCHLAVVLVSSALILSSPAGAAEAPGYVESEAVAVVEDYLNALVVGDIVRLEQTLTDALLEEKQHVVNNPSYGEMLARMYAGASFEILTTEVAPEGVLVNTALHLRNGNTMESLFLVTPSEDGYYKLADER